MAGNGFDNRLFGRSGADLLAGRNGDDVLNGGSGTDTLEGNKGDDRLIGDDGLDSLVGGSGNDILVLDTGDRAFGGSGEDRFLFQATSGEIVIGDFDGERLGNGRGEDKLVFATGLEQGAFAYLGSGDFSAAGRSEARFAGDQRVEVDLEGDGAADVLFEIEGLAAAGRLTAADFLWL